MSKNNYDRLSQNKQGTQVNIKSYLGNEQEVNHDQRKLVFKISLIPNQVQLPHN